MKSKKKSHNKSRPARSNKAAKPVKAVETPNLDNGTLSEVELTKEIEIPSTDISLPSEKEEITSNAEQALAHEELSIIEQESSNYIEQNSTKEQIAPKEEEEIKNNDQKILEKVVEMPSNVLPKTIEADKPIEKSTMMSIVPPADKAPVAAPIIVEDIKHPLEHNWGYWINTNENKKNWTENQKVLTMFNTVEDYWCLYHHMKLPSELQIGQDYAIFKQGIKPMWEDTANKVGGKWFINLERKGHEVDRIWLDVVLLMIGENFENSDVICGAVVNLKQHSKHRVSIWTRNKDESCNMEIGKKLKEILRLNIRLQFIDHKTNNVLYVI